MEIEIKAKNGMSIYGYKNPSLGGFFISLFLRAGNMYEAPGEEGISHFLEHVLVRNVNKLTDMKLYQELDRKGMVFNASTYSEMVQFYTAGASHHFRDGAVIIDKLFSPIVLTAEEISAERKRIKAEIRENDDKSSISQLATSKVFEGTSLAGSITGSLGSVNRIGTTKLSACQKEVFTADNAFIYVSGSYTDEDMAYLVDLVGSRQLFLGKTRQNLAPVPKSFGKRAPEITVKNAEYSAVRFSFDIDMTKVRGAAVDLLYDILLSGYNAPFFVELSEERGLFYDISGHTEYYKNIGVFHFGFELREKNLYDAIAYSVKILSDFKAQRLLEDECMKAGYVDNARLLLDDARDYNFTFAYDCHILGTRYSSVEGRASLYAGITPEEIRATACEIFRPENLTLTLKGNKKRIDLEKIKASLMLL